MITEKRGNFVFKQLKRQGGLAKRVHNSLYPGLFKNTQMQVENPVCGGARNHEE
jgi:hypothetical protein